MQDDFTPDDRYELAWAAGFFDGEGCTSVSHHRRKERQSYSTVFVVSMSQNSVEPLERFRKAIGGSGFLGGPYLPPSRMPGRKPYWQYRATGTHAEGILTLLWPWLCTAKREQAEAALLRFRTIRMQT